MVTSWQENAFRIICHLKRLVVAYLSYFHCCLTISCWAINRVVRVVRPYDVTVMVSSSFSSEDNYRSDLCVSLRVPWRTLRPLHHGVCHIRLVLYVPKHGGGQRTLGTVRRWDWLIDWFSEWVDLMSFSTHEGHIRPIPSWHFIGEGGSKLALSSGAWYQKQISTLIARFMRPTWGPPRSCRSQVGPMFAPWTLLSGKGREKKLQPTNTVGCNYLPLHLIPASDTTLLN